MIQSGTGSLLGRDRPVLDGDRAAARIAEDETGKPSTSTRFVAARTPLAMNGIGSASYAISYRG